MATTRAVTARGSHMETSSRPLECGRPAPEVPAASPQGARPRECRRPPHGSGSIAVGATAAPEGHDDSPRSYRCGLPSWELEGGTAAVSEA
jgi:hypothetical protein